MATRYGWMADTSEGAFRKLIELQRRMSGVEKLERALEWSATLTRMSEAAVRRKYPDASDREVFLRTAAIRLGRETVRRVYGWDSTAKGTT